MSRHFLAQKYLPTSGSFLSAGSPCFALLYANSEGGFHLANGLWDVGESPYVSADGGARRAAFHDVSEHGQNFVHGFALGAACGDHGNGGGGYDVGEGSGIAGVGRFYYVRAHFEADSDGVKNVFRGVADDLRAILADQGIDVGNHGEAEPFGFPDGVGEAFHVLEFSFAFDKNGDGNRVGSHGHDLLDLHMIHIAAIFGVQAILLDDERNFSGEILHAAQGHAFVQCNGTGPRFDYLRDRGAYLTESFRHARGVADQMVRRHRQDSVRGVSEDSV